MNAAPGIRLGQLPSFVRTCVRQAHTRVSPGLSGPEGHGEKIWIFNHRRSDQVIYSFQETLDGVHHHKQLPFNGKKTKPSKLRKDYWSPMAMISFPSGQGPVGRSVFQKLRELKHLHEVAWEDDFRYKRPEEYTATDRKRITEEEEKGNKGYRPIRTKEERGIALNAQKQNSIADVAAVLAGQGRGNKIVTNAASNNLLEVTVTWANDQDKKHAQEWSSNVTHALFDRPSYVSNADKAEEAETAEAAEAASR